MKSPTNEMQGSAALALLNSIAVGVFVTLGFANVSHYLAAKNALQQASRVVARCLSPTDPECLSLSAQNEESLWSWNAFPPPAPMGDIIGDEYDYSAKLYRAQYTGQNTYYSIPEVLEPNIEITRTELPVYEWKKVPKQSLFFLTTTYSGVKETHHAVPKSPAFPHFDQNEEILRQNSAFKEYPVEFKTVAIEPFSIRLSSTDPKFENLYEQVVEVGKGRWISLSSLIKAEPDFVDCKPGKSCNVTAYSAEQISGNSNDFLRRRYLALYIEVQIQSKSAEALFGIEGATNSVNNDGLVVSLGSNGNIRRTLYLGGRDAERTVGSYFNLWLRGPANSVGRVIEKAYPNPPKHSGIAIMKNESFNPLVRLKLLGKPRDQIQGKVIVHAFADSYSDSPERKTHIYRCKPVSIPRGKSISSVKLAPRFCEMPDGLLEIKELNSEVAETKLSCGMNEEAGWPEGVIPQDREQTLEVQLAERGVKSVGCLPSDKPEIHTECGWRISRDTGETVSLPTSAAEKCILSKTKSKDTFSCNDNTKPIARCFASPECSSYLKEQEKLSKLSEKLKNESVLISSSLLTPPLSAITIPGSLLPQRLSCSPFDSNGNFIPCAEQRIENFSSEGWELNNGEVSTEIFDTTRNVPKCNISNVTKTNSKLVEITGYPFSGERELEIKQLLPELKGGLISCDQNRSSRSIEETLRQFAALNGFEGAKNPDVKFDFQAIPLGTKQFISRSINCKQTRYSDLNSCSQATFIKTGEETCGLSINLGIHRDPPPYCSLPGIKCTKTLFSAPEAVIQPMDLDRALEKAISLGKATLKKFLPGSSSDCKDSGCTEINSKLIDNETISVSASYNFPLTWPLSGILGKKSFPISASISERMEAL